MQHGFVADSDPQLAAFLDEVDGIAMGYLGGGGELVIGSLEGGEFVDDKRGRAVPIRLDGHRFATGTGELPMRRASLRQQKRNRCDAALVLPGIDPEQMVGCRRLAKP